MFQQGFAPVVIAGRRTGQSLFSSSVADGFGFHSALAGRVSMGQTDQEWYVRAKAAVSKFDSLVERLKKIANRGARESLVSRYGLDNPTDKDRGKYMRDAVFYNVFQAESYTPVNYLVFGSTGPARRRVGDLEDVNRDFSDDVKAAENTYGILPEPVIIERIVEVPGTVTTVTPSWVVPAAVVGGGIAVAALLGII